MKIKRALISVADKTGIEKLASELHGMGVELISTGGTAHAIREAGVPVTEVAEVTGFPEILDGRVKTLHPVIHGALLCDRGSEEHMRQLDEHGIEPIDLVVVNLYPFREVVARGASREEVIENIDIGGPTMLRSAAKNHEHVAVVVNPGDYSSVLSELRETGEISGDTRKALACEVFAHTRNYDQAIASYLSGERTEGEVGEFDDEINISMKKVQTLRYGENPHQKACFYAEKDPAPCSMAAARKLSGKELSFNNINDTDAALQAVCEFEEPTVVGLKHTNPCGVASADTISEATRLALDADPVSIFGGIVAFNRPVDRGSAEALSEFYLECIIAPDYTDGAREVLAEKDDLRLLQVDMDRNGMFQGLDYKRVSGGLLIQEGDFLDLNPDELETVTDREPTTEQMKDLRFAWKVVKHVKSNAIVVAKDRATVGVGAGQVNRIWATRQAIRHGEEATEGAVLASDAFFPFKDAVEAASGAGIRAIIQPGGSIRDSESIAACNEHGIAMVFTGVRHFRH